MKLFYDISELGWVRYLSAHINYLHSIGEEVSICTNSSREVFYRGKVKEILPIPDEFYENFGEMQSDGNCLFDIKRNQTIRDHDLISKPFQKKYPNYDIVKKYSQFYGERKFEPYQHSKEAEEFIQKFRKVIIIFPRHRESIFSRRNLGKERWHKIIDVACKKYTDYDILTIGGKSSTFDIDFDYNNYFNLTDNDNMLDILVALCNCNKVISTFGTESGISLVSTICKCNSFIIGKGVERIKHENFCNAYIKCYRVNESENGYVITDFNNIIDEFIKFTDMMIFLSNNKYL